MAITPSTTLEQWAVLRLVIEVDGFAQAAERMHKSQSSISYTIARLQERLGIELLRIDGRKAHLTEIGHTLLAEVTPLIDELIALEKRGRLLSDGHEAKVRLLVDSIFPKSKLFSALKAFQALYPEVDIELEETVRSSLPDPRLEPFDLAISFRSLPTTEEYRLCDVKMIAVAGGSSPLKDRANGPISLMSLMRHRVVNIQNSLSNKESGAHRNQWKVNSIEAAIEAVGSGLCYGWLPTHLIRDKLASGELWILPLATGATRLIPLTLTFGDQALAGVATRTMATLLSETNYTEV